MTDHVDFANELLRESGIKSHLYAEPFHIYCERDELPQFDFIALHGVWSWINGQDRETITQFLQEKLKPNGLVYISYNSLPGQAHILSFRHLFVQNFKTECKGTSDTTKAINEAFAKIENLASAGSRALTEDSRTIEHIKSLKSRDASYLAHEYLNDSWEPMYFDEVSNQLGKANLNFLDSSHLLDHIPAFAFDKKQAKYLNDVDSTEARQLAIDYITNRQFRREYWIKSESRSQDQTILGDIPYETEFVQIVHKSKIKLKINADAGTFSLDPMIYTLLMDVLDNQSSPNWKSLVKIFAEKKISKLQTVEAIKIFLACGYISVAINTVSPTVASRCFSLNQYLFRRSRSNADISFFAAPKIQGGMFIPRTHQLFLSEIHRSESKSKLILVIAEILSRNGEYLNTGTGEPVSYEDTKDELESQYEAFTNEYLPRYRMLGIVP